MSKQTGVAVSDRPSLTDKATARIVRNLAMTPAAEEFLGDLSHKTGLSEGEVLRLARHVQDCGRCQAAGEARRRRQYARCARY